LNSDTSAARLPAAKHRAFTSLSNGDFRIYFFAATAAMTADNIEHVISYRVMFQKFHSPALGAFAVVSHWVPYLFLGAHSGRLADRFDIRRLIQVGMLLFIGVSISWAPRGRRSVADIRLLLRHFHQWPDGLDGRHS
jgi:MFS family permease